MQPPASFQSRDPSAPEFWTERFDHSFMPWDRGSVPPELQEFVANAATPGSVLIPGCGTGYEVAFLSEAGWDVTAIDFSPAAVATARSVLGPWASRVVQADFFTFRPPTAPDLIYERAFLCALPRRLWPAVAARWAELLPAGALLAGFFFSGDDPKGPPFGIAPAELDMLLMSNFEPIECKAVADSVPVFAGRESWQVWRRRP